MPAMINYHYFACLWRLSNIEKKKIQCHIMAFKPNNFRSERAAETWKNFQERFVYKACNFPPHHLYAQWGMPTFIKTKKWSNKNHEFEFDTVEFFKDKREVTIMGEKKNRHLVLCAWNFERSGRSSSTSFGCDHDLAQWHTTHQIRCKSLGFNHFLSGWNPFLYKWLL